LSPAAFICTTKSERTDDIKSLGDYLEGMGYNVYFRKDYCSPEGIKEMADQVVFDNLVVLMCPRKLGRDVFSSVLEPDTEFYSYDTEGEPRELANRIHSEVIMASQMSLGLAPDRTALVVGGGVAGVYAALDIAEQGFKVRLVESDPSIGGVMAALDKTFPTMDCSI